MATYGQEQAEKLLQYYQGLSGTMAKPSLMASPEEKKAYAAQEARAGRAPMEVLPEEYGGRPTGESRRSIRMAAEYDEAQNRALEQERIRQQMENEQKELALRTQEQQSIIESRNLARDAAVVKAARDAKVKEQSKRFMEAVLGTTLPDGTRTKPIDIYDDKAVESIQSQMYMNDFGMEDPYVRDVAKTLLDDAMRIREQKVNALAAQTKANTEARVGLAKDLAQNGLSIADYSKDGIVDFEKANIALGEALKKKEEGKEEKMDEREQRRSLARQKAEAETELVKIKSQVGRFEKLRPTTDNQRELDAARVSQGIFEDEINRINRELGGETPAEPEATEGPTTPSAQTTPEPAMELPEGKDVIQVALDGVGGATLDSRGRGLSDRAINVRDTLLNDPTSQEAVSAIRMSGLKTADDLLAAINYVESVNIENSEKNPLKITSKEDFERMPSGMMFIAPDGTRRRKQ